jgi:DtxR family Mn-dependent transcriptional regulator
MFFTMVKEVQQRLSESLEDYLEAILYVQEDKGAARPKDLSRRLGVGPSAVTAALKTLAEKGLVNYAPYEVVTLTKAGQRIAIDVDRRHRALREFFVRVLDVDPEIADAGACRMEHSVPREIVDRFIRFVDFVEICPRGGPGFIRGFRHHYESGCTREQCGSCMEELVAEAGGGQA